MFLGLLDDRKKELFLGLAIKLAQADGDYSDAENLMIQGYCQEMQMVFRQDMIRDLDKIISELSSVCEEKEKRIIVFEVIGLALSDGEYGAEEKHIVTQLQEQFHMASDYVQKCEDAIYEYLMFQNKLNKLVVG